MAAISFHRDASVANHSGRKNIAFRGTKGPFRGYTGGLPGERHHENFRSHRCSVPFAGGVFITSTSPGNHCWRRRRCGSRRSGWGGGRRCRRRRGYGAWSTARRELLIPRIFQPTIRSRPQIRRVSKVCLNGFDNRAGQDGVRQIFFARDLAESSASLIRFTG
jgi:hypothetical protein